MCDVKGCHKVAYAEVYHLNNHTWSYLCKHHYNEEQSKYKKSDKIGFYELTTIERLKSIFYSIIFYIKGWDKK